MATAFVLLGSALQLIGAGATAWGAKLIWREVVTPEETLVGPAVDALRRTVTRNVTRLIRVFRKPRPRTVQGQLSLTIPSPSLTARGYMNFRNIPDDISTAAAISELDDRTQKLMRQIAQLTNKLDDEIEARQAKTATMHDELSAALTEHAERERRRTVTGLRYEAAGLFLLALGTTINALAAVLEGNYQP